MKPGSLGENPTATPLQGPPGAFQVQLEARGGVWALSCCGTWVPVALLLQGWALYGPPATVHCSPDGEGLTRW